VNHPWSSIEGCKRNIFCRFVNNSSPGSSLSSGNIFTGAHRKAIQRVWHCSFFCRYHIFFCSVIAGPNAILQVTEAKRKAHNMFYNFTEPFFNWLNKEYGSLLEGFMKRRWLAFIIILMSGVGIYFFMKIIPSELSPMEDRSMFRVIATGPEGATFEYMDIYVNKLLKVIDENVPESEIIISITSPGFGGASSNSAMGIAKLRDADQRQRSQSEIVNSLRPKVNDISMARAFIAEPQSIGSRRSGLPVQYVIQAPTLDKLKEVIPAFLESARQDPAFELCGRESQIYQTGSEGGDQAGKKHRSMGVSVRDVAQTLQLGLSGQRFGSFVMNGKQYYVIGQVRKENRNDPLDLRSLYVRSNNGSLIQLDNLITMEEQSSPPQLYRYNRFVSATDISKPIGKYQDR
jgi:multidrug efflux pump